MSFTQVRWDGRAVPAKLRGFLANSVTIERGRSKCQKFNLLLAIVQTTAGIP
jgi:hypothetical protein